MEPIITQDALAALRSDRSLVRSISRRLLYERSRIIDSVRAGYRVEEGKLSLGAVGIEMGPTGPEVLLSKTDYLRAEGFELHAWNFSEGVFESIEDIGHNEYFALKRYLAEMRASALSQLKERRFAISGNMR